MVHDNIRNGKYTNRFPFVECPPRPQKPAGFDADSTLAYAIAYEEYKSIHTIWSEVNKAYWEDAKRVELEFRQDAISEVFGSFADEWPRLIDNLYDYFAKYEPDLIIRLTRLNECLGFVKAASIDKALTAVTN